MSEQEEQAQVRRLTAQDVGEDEYWAKAYARAILEVYPKKDVYTVAAGISPSGVVHFGNFRDIATSYAVLRALEDAGKNVRFLFFWDEYDRFRKVPKDVPSSFLEHIGKPLTSVPDPLGEFASYAERFETPFIESLVELGIPIVHVHQSERYTQGVYAGKVIQAMKKREVIAEVLLSFMSEKAKAQKQIDEEEYRASFYPISIYSRFSGKDTTTILSYDGASKVTYRCHETGQEDTIDLTTDFLYKLNWKVDWAMRWHAEGVLFEPGGKDHASPGGSYDVSAAIIRAVYGSEPPFFAGYEFIGIQGVPGKMSGSKGGAVSPGQLLEIYEPALVKWLYFRKAPEQVFNLAFDTEIIRQYDEFDREVAACAQGTLPPAKKDALLYADAPISSGLVMPFRQAVAFGQIFQWQAEKVVEFFKTTETPYGLSSVASRLSHAKAWLETYNPSELIEVRETRNDAYIEGLSEEEKGLIRLFREALSGTELHDIASLEVRMYDIPKDPALSQKENGPRQRAFFAHIYQLLIGKERGPRLSTFLWALDRKRVLDLLDV